MRRECANNNCTTLISKNANKHTRRCARCVREKIMDLELYDNTEKILAIKNANPNRDYRKDPLQVLSYGGGVQSSVLLLLVKDGLIAPPDVVVHSDTGSEMKHTEEVIEWARLLCVSLGVPFVTVSSHRGRLHEDYLSTSTMPMVRHRSCTFNFKIQPQRKFFRKIVGKGNGKVLVICWMGITTDESNRRISQEHADVKWTNTSYPFLDNHKMSRKDCVERLKQENLAIKKSGCFLCPYAPPKHFAKLHRDNPELFAIALEMETRFNERWAKEQGEKSLSPSLKTLKSVQMPSLENWGFEFDLNPEGECSSGHCFY